MTRWKSAAAALGAFLAALFVARRASDAGGGGGPYRPPGGEPLPVDPYAPKETATGCDPVAKPGVLAFRQWAIAKWGQREKPPSPQNIIRACDDTPDEHQEGRAWDLMTRDIAHGQAIWEAMLAPDENGEPNALARRAGVMYIIWNKQMWRAYPHAGKPNGSISPYTGASPHTDHLHFSFSKAGAAGQTSLYKIIGEQFPSA